MPNRDCYMQFKKTESGSRTGLQLLTMEHMHITITPANDNTHSKVTPRSDLHNARISRRTKL
ncbi:uncharacterized protein BO88DRAFT_403573 [Aspergillus vadensis CBS 113365]|uniref:Uncharacterized protein n=1 Tax=Aspergillus vadensis (strain CBS 113365 / IMI 142717 / IBT 24658) TaxID=1448311 RepID=A0A319BEQ6_ASPVC|nr:hypothetical protein BO88DRAFT_403573 [Aspergillus vadensis CBS 113365]PYH70599.1 hypothetical protein BO88DRAFT_403573 [Aspergillus vadensis CBS 113365]